MNKVRAMFARCDIVSVDQEGEDRKTKNYGFNDECLLWFLGRYCVPNDKDLRQSILQEVHASPYAIHLIGNKMYWDVKKLYWWPKLKQGVIEFVAKCLICQQVKAKHQFSFELLQPIKIPQWKWVRITMDFFARIFLKNVGYVIYFGDCKKKLHEALGTLLDLSTSFHPQTDGQLERVIQILKDMMRACIIEFRGNWEERLSLAKFSYNNIFH
ncbi:polyprotein [Gossypium australe]|uniref:Polyprotein n=1 Tax=Gossypium australe TaxID=47621 RepID=A0A5B6W6N5_9ROSI|nr:polyprotein [Gossypium australe]